MMRPLQPSSAAGGFTLLELLVATAVGAIVLLVIHATFFSALRLYQGTNARLDEDLALQRTFSLVRQDLAGIMLPGGVLSGQLQTTDLSSSTQEVEGDRVSPDLYTNSGRVDGWTPFADVQRVAYYLAPATDGSAGKNLVRAVTRNLLPAEEPVPESQTLLTGVSSAEMLFYDGVDWTADWDSTVTSTLPGAIKLSVVLEPPAGSQQAPGPIELIVPVLVSTRASQKEQEEAAGS